jgi:hypothetical protein
MSTTSDDDYESSIDTNESVHFIDEYSISSSSDNDLNDLNDLNRNIDDDESISTENSDDSIVIIDEFDIDDFDEDNLEQIERQDVDHLYGEKEHGHYYVGLCKYMRNPKIFLMANTVSTRIFFKFEFQRIFRYLNCYSSMMITNPKVEIMKLNILHDQTYSVVLKTHWLRLIQRHWKKAYKKRCEVIKVIKSVTSLQYRETHGRFPYGLSRIPSIWGLMRDYSK